MNRAAPAPLKRPSPALAALAALSLPLATLSLPLVIIIPEYYTSVIGLSLAAVGLTFTAVRLLDIVFDPLVGILMDQTRTRMGRIRPWLVLGAPLLMAATGMLFFAQQGVTELYFFIALALTFAAWSIVSLAQLALGAALADDYDARSRVFGWIQAVAFLGNTLVMVLPFVLHAADATQGAHIMGGLIIAITIPTAAVAFLLVPERAPRQELRPHASLGVYIDALRNSAVFRLVLADIVYGLAFGLSSAVLVFFFTAVRDLDRGSIGLLIIVQMAGATFGQPLVAWCSYLLGKTRALVLFGLIAALVPPLLLFIPDGYFLGVAIVMGVWGGAYGGVATLPRAMMADASDAVRLQTGHDRTGLLYALLISSWKLGGALSVGLAFLTLQAMGYEARLGADNDSDALNGLTAVYLGSPLILSTIGSLIAMTYPITRARHAEIQAKLQAVPDVAPS